MKNKDKSNAMTPSKTDQQQLTTEMNQADLQAMFGDLNTNDISVPRLTVLQGLSPEVADGLGKPGRLFIKGLNQEVGTEIEIIPILRSRSRIRWKDLDKGGGILCQSFDGKLGNGDPGGNCETCSLSGWVDNKAPSCDLYENVIVVLRQEKDWFPIALSGSRTKLKAMKDLNTLFMAEMIKRRPLFMKSYIVKVIEKTNKSNLRYFSFRITMGNNNQVLPDEEVAKANQIFNQIKGKTISVQQEQTEGREPINEEI